MYIIEQVGMLKSLIFMASGMVYDKISQTNYMTDACYEGFIEEYWALTLVKTKKYKPTYVVDFGNAIVGS